MSYLWLWPLFFGAVAIGLALENAWADSARLRRWQMLAWAAAIISFLAIDQGVMTRIVGPGQHYVHDLITDGCCEGLFPPKDQKEQAKPTNKQSNKKITDRLTTPTAQKRNMLVERLSSTTRSGKTYRFSAFYPRRKFLPGYDEWASFYPSLVRVFDAIEMADFIAARLAIQETRALLSGSDKRALQGYLSHLHTMIMLELGDRRSVLLNFPPARKELEVAGASDLAMLRLDLDHAVAQLAYGLPAVKLNPFMGTKLRANADGNLQELAQYYFFLAMQHASVGEVRSANLMLDNALSYARRLETTDKLAGNRVVALLGEEHGPFVRDAATADPILTPSPRVRELPTDLGHAVFEKTPKHTVFYENALQANGLDWSVHQKTLIFELRYQLERRDAARAYRIARMLAIEGLEYDNVIRRRRAGLTWHVIGQILLEANKPAEAAAALKFAIGMLTAASAPRLELVRAQIDYAAVQALGGIRESLLPGDAMAFLERDRFEHVGELVLGYRALALKQRARGQHTKQLELLDKAVSSATELARRDDAKAARYYSTLALLNPKRALTVSQIYNSFDDVAWPGMHLVPMINVPDCLRRSATMQADDSVYDVLLGMHEEGQFAAVAATTRAIIYSEKYKNLGARPRYIACLWFLRAAALMEMGDIKVAISSLYAARSIFIRHGSTREAYINVTVALFYAETLAGGTDTDLLNGILGTMNALEEAYRLELITLYRALAMRSQALGKTSESMAHLRTARDHAGKLALTHPKFALQLQNAIAKSVPTP